VTLWRAEDRDKPLLQKKNALKRRRSVWAERLRPEKLQGEKRIHAAKGNMCSQGRDGNFDGKSGREDNPVRGANGWEGRSRKIG